ncbi:MAG: transglycosylase SLT domain-containing protein [Ectothiorhodospiraceae bacterium]|nr:transglycosylase SLT domain-containing protein [Ectothiorhodospiraceae bacterium]
MKRWFSLLPLLAALLLSGSVMAAGQQEQQRERFLDAWQALRDGKTIDLEALERELADYPLTPYLRFHALNGRLGSVTADELERFLERHGDLPVTGQLAYRWLLHQGRRGDWEAFRAADRGQGGAAMDCYRLRAERHLDGVDEAWLERTRTLWTVGHSQPDACDPVFAELYERQAISAERGWERIRLVMGAGNIALARALSGRLERNEQRWLEHWLAVAADPQRALQTPAFDVHTSRGRQLVSDGIRRLGVRDQDAAVTLLDRYQDRGWLIPEEEARLRRHVALRAAFSGHENAQAWLDALPEAAMDDQVREWAARTALRRQDWPRLREAVQALPPALQAQAEWRYWDARALLKTGDTEQGRALLRELAGERHYYGFLAADTLNLPYSMNHRPGPRDESRLQELADRSGIRRAQEFLAIGYHEEARREWLAALSGAGSEDWAQAAQLARDWGWYDRMVHAANRAGLHDALELRFPLAFRELMAQRATQGDLDLGLAYALMRKESAFSPDARSPAGALGLMQVMPATGQRVAERLGLDGFGTGLLLEPEINVQLGAAYLEQMLERFGGNLILAAAAYNAGPSRVDRWLEDYTGQPADVWIERITFGETRDYVKSVLAFRAVFDWQLYGEPRRLAGVMPQMPFFDESLQLALRESDQGE